MQAPPVRPRALASILGRHGLVLERFAGAGRFARVLQVRDPSSGRRFALKVARGRQSSHLVQEIAFLRELRHPGVVELVAAGRSGHFVYALLGWIEGRPWPEAWREASDRERLEDLVQLLRTLQFVHGREIVHADLSARNVLVRSGAPRKVQLLDFGLAASLADSAGRPLPGATARYAAPEVLRGRAADTRGDLFALGALVLEASGLLPSGELAANWVERAGDDWTRASRDRLPEALVALLPRLLASAPESRPASAWQALEMLGEVAGEAIPLESEAGAIAYASPRPGLLRAGICAELTSWAGAVGSNESPLVVALRGAPGSGERELLDEGEQAALAAGYEVIRLEPRADDAPGEALRRAGIDPPVVVPGGAESLEERRDRVEAARAACVDRLLVGERLVVFEAVDMADEETSAVAAQLIRALVESRSTGREPGVRLLLSTAGEAPGADRWAELDRKVGSGAWRRQLDLDPLSASDVERWLRTSFGVEGGAAALWSSELVQHGDGRAVLIQRLLERAILRGAISPGVDQWQLDERPPLEELTAAGGGLPPAYRGGSEPLRLAADILATSGRSLAADLLQEVADGSEDVTAAALSEGRERRLLFDRLGPDGLELGFVEPESGPAIARSMSARACKRLQRALALAFEARDRFADAAELWFAAKETDRALEVVESGFDALVRHQDLRRAFELGRRAYRPLLQRDEERAVRLAIRLADLSLWLGEPKTAERWLSGASRRECAAQGPIRAALERRRAEAACERGKYREAVAACQRAKSQGEASAPEELQVLRLEAFALSMLGDHEGAVRVCRLADPIDSSAAGSERAALANIEALSELRLGRLERAEQAAGRGLEAAEADADDWWIAALENTSGLLARQRGRADEAGRFFESALERFRSASALKKVAHCRNNLGIISAESGDFAAAEHQHRAALEIFERLGDPYGTASFTGSLAIDRLQRGCPVLARLGLDEALRLLRGVSAPREEALMQIYQALAYVRTGDRHRAHRALERAAASIEEFGLKAARQLWLVPALELAGLEGDRARFESLWETAGERPKGEIEIAALRARLALEDLSGVRRALERLAEDGEGWPPTSTAWLRFIETWARSTEESPARILDQLDELLGRTQDVALRAACCFVLARVHREAGQPARADDWSQRGRRELELVCQGATQEETEGTVMAFRKLTSLMGPEFDAEFAGTAARASAPASLADLEEVYEVTRRLNSEDNPKRLMTFILDTAVRLTLAERGFLVLRRRKGLRFVVARDAQQADIPSPDSEVSHSILEDVLETGRSVVTTDAGGDERFQAAASVEALDLTSVVCVPFRVGDRILGALYLDNPYRKGLFSERELRLAEAFSDQAGIAYRNLQERSRIRRLNRELRERVVRQDRELRQTRRELADGRGDQFGSIIGVSREMRRVFQLIERLSRTDLSVLIEGESGTGKELVAREIHRRSARADGPFLSENCSAIPRELLESEFFGHVKGSFTGATETRDGLFVLASGGTLFLDEIGDMDLDLQKKLLRVLQEGEVRPVGGKKTRAIDVRIVAATHRDLRAMIEAGEFREDLYYRINVASIPLPALRDRRDDIDPLIDHFLARLAQKQGLEKPLSPAVRSRLRQYDWPGNVRQLENEVARLYALSDTRIDDLELLSETIRDPRSVRGAAPAETGGALPSLADIERSALQETLDATGWDKEEAARILGISRTSVYAKIKKYDLQPGKR